MKTYTDGERVTTEAEAMDAMRQGWGLLHPKSMFSCIQLIDGVFIKSEDSSWSSPFDKNREWLKNCLPLTVTTPDPTLFEPGMTVPAALAERLCWAGWAVKRECFTTEWGRVENNIKALRPDGSVMNQGDGLQPGKLSDNDRSTFTLLRYEPWRVPSDEYKWTGEEAAEALRAGMWGCSDISKGDLGGWVRAHGERVLSVKDPDPSSSYVLKRMKTNDCKWCLRWPEQTQEVEEMETTMTMTKAEKLEKIRELCAGNSGVAWSIAHDILNTPEPDMLSPGEALDWARANEHDSDAALICADGDPVRAETILSWDAENFIDFAPFTLAPPKPEYETVNSDGLEFRCYADRVEVNVPDCGEWICTRRVLQKLVNLSEVENAILNDAAFSDRRYYRAEVWEKGTVTIEQTTFSRETGERILDAMRGVEENS